MVLRNFFVAFLAIFMVGLISATTCPNGAEAQGSYCFIASKESAVFTKAYMYCAAYSCNVAIPDSADKRSALATYAGSNSISANSIFFGATDELSDGQFVKITTAEEWTDIDWDGSNPDGGTSKNCLTTVSFSTWKMDDVSCGDKKKFICECDSTD